MSCGKKNELAVLAPAAATANAHLSGATMSRRRNPEVLPTHLGMTGNEWIAALDAAYPKGVAHIEHGKYGGSDDLEFDVYKYATVSIDLYPDHWGKPRPRFDLRMSDYGTRTFPLTTVEEAAQLIWKTLTDDRTPEFVVQADSARGKKLRPGAYIYAKPTIEKAAKEAGMRYRFNAKREDGIDATGEVFRIYPAGHADQEQVYEIGPEGREYPSGTPWGIIPLQANPRRRTNPVGMDAMYHALQQPRIPWASFSLDQIKTVAYGAMKNGDNPLYDKAVAALARRSR